MGHSHLTAFLLVGSLALASPVAAQSRLARPLTAEEGARLHDARVLQWTGIALSAGGGVLEILSFSALAHEESACVFGYYSYLCASERSTNWGVWSAGMGVAVTGSILWWMGNGRAHDILHPSRVSIAPLVGKHRYGVTARIRR